MILYVGYPLVHPTVSEDLCYWVLMGVENIDVLKVDWLACAEAGQYCAYFESSLHLSLPMKLVDLRDNFGLSWWLPFEELNWLTDGHMEDYLGSAEDLNSPELLVALMLSWAQARFDDSEEVNEKNKVVVLAESWQQLPSKHDFQDSRHI